MGLCDPKAVRSGTAWYQQVNRPGYMRGQKLGPVSPPIFSGHTKSSLKQPKELEMPKLTDEQRTEYLRGIASTAPERTVEVGGPARHAIFKAAFEQVEDKSDWKNPINALVTIHEHDTIGLGVYMDAIEYFVGTKPSVFLVSSNDAKTVTTFRIVSEGYRLSQ